MSIGAERAMMIHPSGAYGQFVQGGGRIADKLAKGWLFLASDRNRLLRDADLYTLIDGRPVKVEHDTPEPVALEQPMKRGPGRPRRDQSSFK